MAKNHVGWKQSVVLTLIFSFFSVSQISAQFLDDFNDIAISLDQSGLNGWAFYTGDGLANMDFQSNDGHASILIEATRDKRNIWWALIRRRVSSDMDLSLIPDPRYEFRIEARIRVSHAPRRVNLHLNTQRTTDFHSHLMEFDIPDTLNWHTISMTTRDFDAKPGDTVYGQLASMDWGLEKYRVDLDYFKADIVKVDSIGPDNGVQVPYHPPVPALDKFSHHLKVTHDAMIDIEYPDVNFNDWQIEEKTGKINLLAVSGTQIIILRWDLSQFTGKRVIGSGLLELTTYSVQRSATLQKDFGMIRVVEILGGKPDWQETEIMYNKLCQGLPLNKVLNSQMIIDVNVAPLRGSKNLITISNPVLQRLIDGKTLGIAIRSIGAVNASFYAKENPEQKFSAKLHFNLEMN